MLWVYQSSLIDKHGADRVSIKDHKIIEDELFSHRSINPLVGFDHDTIGIYRTDKILSVCWLRSDIQIFSVGFDQILLSGSDRIPSADLIVLYIMLKR